jgi:DUF1707 SHOCT-like domain
VAAASYPGWVNELPISSPYRSTPDAPVSEDERDQLSRRLNDAFEAGAIEADDYQSRLDQLFAAKRMGELVPVVQGLPPARTYDSPAIVADSAGRPGELSATADPKRLALIGVGAVTVSVLIAVVLLLVLLL